MQRLAGTMNPRRTWRRFLIIAPLYLLINMYAAGNEKTVNVTIKENGSSVTLQKGDLLEVTLPAALGTGFGWHVRNGAEALLRPKGKPFVKKPESEKTKVGAMESQVFQFEAQGIGTAKLELEYVRPWEKETPPAKTFLITLVVK